MMKNFVFFQLPWQFLMLTIFVQSSIGSLKIPDFGFRLSDKVLHFIAFGILAILTARGLRNFKNRIVKVNYISITLLICIAYGILDEFHQYFVPGRYFSWWDWVADILGVISMVWIYKRFAESSELKNKEPGKNGSMI
jgi:VanZ family protein